MALISTQEELEKKLANENLYYTLYELSVKAKTYTGGGAYNHRIVAMGHLATSFVRNIDEVSVSGITKETTFDEFRKLDSKNYYLTLNFLKPLFDLGLYSL